ncbi:MAG: universal stress protein [Propionibacterium sp.]|nr:universal stress protein [Propionibacterium sp.]
MDRIVVGVDGSDESKRALEWAVEETKLRDGVLDLVYVYNPPFVPEGISSPEQADLILKGPEREARRVLDLFAKEAEGVKVEQHAVENSSPAHALVEQSKDATMLVVSARGLGAFRRLVLGSVSQQIAHHAECPVVIIRPH